MPHGCNLIAVGGRHCRENGNSQLGQRRIRAGQPPQYCSAPSADQVGNETAIHGGSQGPVGRGAKWRYDGQGGPNDLGRLQATDGAGQLTFLST